MTRAQFGISYRQRVLIGLWLSAAVVIGLQPRDHPWSPYARGMAMVHYAATFGNTCALSSHACSVLSAVPTND